MKGIEIISTGSSIPVKKVTNNDMSVLVDTSDEWIYSRTGIHSRHFCSEGESCQSLAIGAASEALAGSGLAAEDIGCVIVATMSGNYATPSISCMIQQALSLPEDIPVVDINAACSGFIYGLEIARGFLSASTHKYGLIIGCEQLSRLLDMTDRSTCVLFGDGAGAAVIRFGNVTCYESYLGARGGTEIICNGAGYDQSFIKMDGTAVFKFAVTAIPKCINRLFNDSGMSFEDIDSVVCHQANSRIIDHCIRSMKAPADKFYKDMEHFGNTSAASIPLALDEMNKDGLLHKGSRLLLVGFGSGLTYGGAIISFSGNSESKTEEV